MTDDKKPYAVCDACGAEFADRDEVKRHGDETMTPTGNDTGVIAQGHSVRIVTPTPEELRARSIRMTVADAIDEALEQLQRQVDRGDFTASEVSNELRCYPDFGDSWDELDH